MKKIFKYKIDIADQPVVKLPRGARILSIGVQAGELYLWAIVNAEEYETDLISLALVPTGGNLFFPIEKSEFLQTVQFHNAQLIFHVFRIF